MEFVREVMVAQASTRKCSSTAALFPVLANVSERSRFRGI